MNFVDWAVALGKKAVGAAVLVLLASFGADIVFGVDGETLDHVVRSAAGAAIGAVLPAIQKVAGNWSNTEVPDLGD